MKRLVTILRGGLRAAWALLCLCACSLALAQVCAPPGSLLTSIPSGVINSYYAGNASPTLFPGATTLVLGTVDGRGAAATPAVGDLLMVIQMQDGSYVSSNNSTYGSGTGSGNGSTSVGSAGLYEYVRITAITGSNVTFTPALANSYTWADATAGTAQRRYQVVRVPQYASGTAAGVTAPAWNGSTGGVVALDVRDTLTLGSGTVEGQTNRAIFVAGKGFRGGLGRQLGTTAGTGTSEQDYATAAASGYHGGKGEGIVGTPQYVAIKTNNWGFQNTNPPTFGSATLAVEGYPGGSYARGAPGNAGGGGTDGATPANANDKNAGGGGGGNYGPGGIGGRPWSRPLLDTGGRGGAGYAGTLAFNRIFMGGGGGAGGSNDGTADAAVYTNQGMSCSNTAPNVNGRCSSGAAGGGIVVIRARQVAGSGVIDARGAHGSNVTNDSGGGGGAGGSVVVETLLGGNATIDVTGGDGGNAWAGQAGWAADRHGPGGAGGGGFIAFSPNTMAVSAQVGGGTPGETMSNAGFDEYYGGSGFNGGLTTFQTPNTPGVPQAAQCDPNLSLRKTNNTASLTSPGTTTYTFTVANAGNSASAGTITIADRLPTGLTVVAGPLATGGPQGANWSCTAANATDITCTSTASVAAGGSASFTLAVAVNGANGLSVVNRARVSGGGDPNKTTTATVTLADACTANDTPAGCAVDADTIVAPNLALTKTNGTATLVRGDTVTYTLTVSNGGSTATSGNIVVADILPTGLTFNGTSPFTSGGFNCTVSGQGITCTRATAVASGASASLTFSVVVSPTAPSSVVNRAQVGGGGDPTPAKSAAPTTVTAALCAAPTPPADTFSDPANGCASDADAVTYVSLDLSKDDGQVFISQGGATVYTITVRNVGTAPTARTITVGDLLPSLGTGTVNFTTAGTFTPAGTNGANWSCTRSTNTYTFCVSTVSIPAGGQSVFQLNAALSSTVPAGTQTLNRARVGGGGDVSTGSVPTVTSGNVVTCIADGNPYGCAVDLNTVQAAAPEVRMTKSHPDPQNRAIGSSFNFTLAVTNSGGAAAAVNTVRVVDVIPAGLTFNSVTPSSPFTCSGLVAGAITCSNTIGALNTNTTANITINVTVAAGATNTLVNRAKVSATGDPQNNTAATAAIAQTCTATDVPSLGCAADTVPLNADLQVTKAQRRNGGTFQTAQLGALVGDTLQYQLVVRNAAGSATVGTATFGDLIPFTLNSLAVGTFTTAGGATGCTAVLTGSQLNGTVTALPAGSTCSFIVQGTVASNTSATGVTNTIALTVPSGINDTDATNNQASVNTVVGLANLTVTKSNGLGTVTSGGTTAYTVTVANLGPSPADGARVQDPVAPGLNCVTNPVCVPTGAATCPVPLDINTLKSPGLVIPTLPAGGSVSLALTCSVNASGSP